MWPFGAPSIPMGLEPLTRSTHASSVLEFSNLSYTVKVKKGSPKVLVDDVSFSIRAGEMLAIMGPSGAGKSTLLDLLSGRKRLDAGGHVTLNGHQVSDKDMKILSSFVEQEDALLGTLTARETLRYALELSSPTATAQHIDSRVYSVIAMLGLEACADLPIGTPYKRGLSGGQKRRVSIGCSLVTYPRILYLDEPTSGLDSTAAKEVVSCVAALARKEGIMVLASIHQPSYSTLNEFTDLLLLSRGSVCYHGPVSKLDAFLSEVGAESPPFVPPTDIAMQLLNTDFGGSTRTADEGGRDTIQQFRNYYLEWRSRGFATDVGHHGDPAGNPLEELRSTELGEVAKIRYHTVILSRRMTLNYSRNLLAYGIRGAMYAGMGLMLATIWIRLGNQASTINDRLSVHFYSVAFLAFMSVAGIPGFLEERANFEKETANGLYGALPFVLANSIVTIPFLFACSTLFVLIMYWGIGLQNTAPAVLRYIGFLFLSIYVAESQVLVVAALLPIFVAALAISAFLNGFWMSVGGYFIRAINLPRFWYYSFHWMDYQKYAFELLANSDLRGLEFQCDTSGCPYPSSVGSGAVLGQDVLDTLHIGDIDYGAWAGILVGIMVIYRVALWLALRYIH